MKIFLVQTDAIVVAAFVRMRAMVIRSPHSSECVYIERCRDDALTSYFVLLLAVALT